MVVVLLHPQVLVFLQNYTAFNDVQIYEDASWVNLKEIPQNNVLLYPN